MGIRQENISYRRDLMFWGLAILGCGIDLASKHWMFSQPDLIAGEVRWFWTGHVGLQLTLNEGALFGLGQGAVWLFALCSVAAGVAIPVWLFIYGAARDVRLTATLGCIMGGVFGNLYDRVGMHGLDWGQFHPQRSGEHVYAVRDFILLAWRWSDDVGQRIVWPNFNIADALLVCGAASLLLISWRSGTQEGPSLASQQAESDKHNALSG